MKTILSLDGGGIRGAITVAYLERIEELLKERAGPGEEVRLCDHVDLVGGTSAGSIVAAGLALGMTAKELRGFFKLMAPLVFRRSAVRVPGVQPLFRAQPLIEKLDEIVGDMTLESDKLLTGFALVMKRMDTGSAWTVSNNPSAPYWADPEDGSYVGNRRYKLKDLIRASTAAPHYFEPQLIAVSPQGPPGLFVDGGVSAHNNPALALLQIATIARLGYGWPSGADKLRIISIGTGRFRMTMEAQQARRAPALALAILTLQGMINDSQQQVLTTLQHLGDVKFSPPINSELGVLTEDFLSPDPLFQFNRYDVELDARWLEEELDVKISRKDEDVLRQLDNPAILDLCFEIGVRAAERQVRLDDLGL